MSYARLGMAALAGAAAYGMSRVKAVMPTSGVHRAPLAFGVQMIVTVTS